MKILECKEAVTESFAPSLNQLPEGTCVVVGSGETMDTDVYVADGTDRIQWAIEAQIDKLMKSGRFNAESDTICIEISVGDKGDFEIEE